jgi:hypothetical protein
MSVLPVRDDAVERAPRWSRAFVAVFLGAFALCGLLGIEAWPLTGWHLFSRLRSDHQVTWQAIAVTGSGTEQEVRFERLPRAYSNFRLLMRGFSSLSAADRAAACRAWAEAVRREGTSLASLRLYRVDWYVSYRHGSGSGPPPSRTLLYTCGAEGSLRAQS